MADQPMTLAQAADAVEPVLRHVDLTTREVVAVSILRDHARAAANPPLSVESSQTSVPEHLTLSDGTELRHRTVKSLAEGTRDDSATWSPPPPSFDDVARVIDEAFDADHESQMHGGGPVSREDMAQDAAQRVVELLELDLGTVVGGA